MLDGLLSVVRSEVEDEFINAAHTNVLLMRQMFIQAEKWHLKLQADISELENRSVFWFCINYLQQMFLQKLAKLQARKLFQSNLFNVTTVEMQFFSLIKLY